MESPDDFAAQHRRRLERALGLERREQRPLSYPQVAGFLYGVVAAPHTIVPSRWWPLVLGEEPGIAADDLEGFAGALMALNNFVAQQVLGDRPAFAPGCAPPGRAAEAFGPAATFGQWAEGFVAAHSWLDDEWQRVLAADQRDDVNAALTTLAVFIDRDNAAAMLAEGTRSGETTVDELATATLPAVGQALETYMRVAREVRLQLHAAGAYEDADGAAGGPAGPTPYRREGPQVGRNDPCPCGSGRKYKRCCGARED